MMKMWLVCAIVVLLLTGTSLPAVSTTQSAARKIRALVITGGHEFEKEPFLAMFASMGDVDVICAEQPNAQKLFEQSVSKTYDVIVLYDLYQEISDEAKTAFVRLLERGKGLVVLHHAMADCQAWPEYERIIGGRYYIEATDDHPRSTWKHGQDIAVHVATKDHPVTQGLGDFAIHDETYGGYHVADDVTPLLTTDHPDSGHVLAWAKRYGNARVVVIQLGHDHSAYENPNYRRIVHQAIQWTAGWIPLPKPDADGFMSLFNGKDFDGWVIAENPQGFAVRDGLIVSHSKGKTNAGGGWLRFGRPFRDFVLKVEWRVSPNGNSGVFIRSDPGVTPWATGMEVQISNEPRDDEHCTGSLYGYVPVSPRPDESADKWHAFEIHCVGKHVTVIADGKTVVDTSYDDVEALREKSLSGYVGVQDSHNPGDTWIEFRSIKLREVK